MTTTPRNVIFGTGAIGLATLEALRRRGETVRPAFTTTTTTTTKGAQVVYHTLNPP